VKKILDHIVSLSGATRTGKTGGEELGGQEETIQNQTNVDQEPEDRVGKEELRLTRKLHKGGESKRGCRTRVKWLLLLI